MSERTGDIGPVLVDAHAHLADPGFDADREQVLERAERGASRLSSL